MSDTDTTLAEVRRLLMSEVSGCQERIRELEEVNADLYEALENTIDYLYQQIAEGCKGCFGDCASANPQPLFCPLREMQRDYDQARTALAKARAEEPLR